MATEDPETGADEIRGNPVDELTADHEEINWVPGRVTEEDLRALTSTTETAEGEEQAAPPAPDDPTHTEGEPAPEGEPAREEEAGQEQAEPAEEPAAEPEGEQFSDPVAYYQTPDGARQAHRALQLLQSRVRELEQAGRPPMATPDQQAPGDSRQQGKPLYSQDHPEHPSFQRHYQQALVLQEEHERRLADAQRSDHPEAAVAEVERQMSQKWQQIPQDHLEAIREYHQRRQERLADPDRFYVTRDELDQYVEDKIRSQVERAQRSHSERELIRQHADLLAKDPALLNEVDRAFRGDMAPHEIAELVLRARTGKQALSEVTSRSAHAAGQAALRRESAASTQRRTAGPSTPSAGEAMDEAREYLRSRGIPEDSPEGITMVQRALERALGT